MDYCSICLENIETDSIKILECSHYFHTYCINEWIAHNIRSYICPICRREYAITNQVIIDIQENIEPIIQENIEDNYKTANYTMILLLTYSIVLIGLNIFYLSKNY